jgi:hypothetical protein
MTPGQSRILISLERGEDTIPGIGVLRVTAIVATAADPTVFRSGRGLDRAAHQDSTGGKQKLRGRGRRRIFPRAADALDIGSISCVALISRCLS